MQIHKNLIIPFLVFAFIGFADSTFLAVEHFRGVTPPCSIVKGCATVTTSAYSEIFGIPLSLFGALYYLTALILGSAYLDTKDARFIRIATILVTVGFVYSLFLVYLQLFVLNAICLYCMGSATSTTVLFILSWVMTNKLKKAM